MPSSRGGDCRLDNQEGGTKVLRPKDTLRRCPAAGWFTKKLLLKTFSFPIPLAAKIGDFAGVFLRVAAVILATVVLASGQQLPVEETFIGGGTEPGPDGLWAPGINSGSGTAVQQPAIRYQAFPVSVSFRLAFEAVGANAAKIAIRYLSGNDLVNLALGRRPGTPLASHEALALALGDSTPSAIRLIVFDRRKLRQLALIAETQTFDIPKASRRNVELWKCNFVPGGSASDGIRSGSFQLVSQTFPSRTVKILAHGNGELAFSKNGVVATAVITSVSLRVLSRPFGQFDE